MRTRISVYSDTRICAYIYTCDLHIYKCSPLSVNILIYKHSQMAQKNDVIIFKNSYFCKKLKFLQLLIRFVSQIFQSVIELE